MAATIRSPDPQPEANIWSVAAETQRAAHARSAAEEHELARCSQARPRILATCPSDSTTSSSTLSTELNESRAAAARRTFASTGLDDLITVLEGDARETLAGVGGAVDFVLLDGWKDLCLPVLSLLEPRLAPGTLVVADDVDLADLQPYLDYVREPRNGYQSVTFPVEDGMEISCRL
jgi:predicted O-methyltransferase YrrM